MADDDIQRLLNEVSAATGGTSAKSGGSSSSPVPATAGREVARGGAGGRIAFAVVAGVGMGVFTWVAGIVLPFVDAFSAGVGGVIAGFATAIIAGPPRWFSN